MGAITANNILLISDVIKNGASAKGKRKGKDVKEYNLSKDGAVYTVLTEIDDRRETFADFYTNKKASPAARKTHSEEARDNAVDANSDAKVAESSGTANIESGKSSNTEFFKSSDGQTILGWAKDGKIYLTKAERNQVKAGGKEKNRDDTIKAPPLQKA